MVEIPSEIRRAVKALSDDTRFNILLILSERGEMSFSQLENVTHLNSPNLTYHLQDLKGSALIENFFKRVEDTDSHSFYRITEFSERLIDSLFRVLAPGPILVEYKHTYERKTTIKETWTAEVKFKKLPVPSLPTGKDYRKISVESE